MNKIKTIIAYYSYSGNTREVAATIHNEMDGDIFEIVTKETYPQNYNDAIIQAKNEINKKYVPELRLAVSDIEKYDTIFLGTPNWWGGLPPAVRSFIKFYNLSGKKIILFITHGGGGVQNIMKEIEELCPDCIIEKNIWVGYGNRTAGIQGWLNELNIKSL